MTSMEYLRQIRDIKYQIMAYEQTIKELRASSKGLTASYSDMPKVMKNSGLDDMVVKLEAESTKLKEKINKLIDLRQEIMDMIGNVGNMKQSAVLHMYYVNNLTLKAISKYFNVHQTTICDWKATAELRFDKIYRKKFEGNW